MNKNCPRGGEHVWAHDPEPGKYVCVGCGVKEDALTVFHAWEESTKLQSPGQDDFSGGFSMSNPRKQLGKALENKAAEMAKDAGFNAQVQPLSGVLKDFPNDVLIEGAVLVECKVRSAQISGGEKYITINLDWLRKCIENLARCAAKMGVVVFRAKRSQDVYVLLRYEDFLQLLQDKNSLA